MKEKSKIGKIKYLGTMYAKNCYGNDNAEKMIKWLRSSLENEMEKNMRLEIENFNLSIKKIKKPKLFGIF